MSRILLDASLYTRGDGPDSTQFLHSPPASHPLVAALAERSVLSLDRVQGASLRALSRHTLCT